MYKKLPGAEKMLTPAPPADAPPSIRTAIRLMYAGAVVTFIYFVVSLASLGGVKNEIRDANHKLTNAQVNSVYEYLIVTTVVFGVIGIALWLTMARGASNGRRWSQIISTVLFVLYTFEALATFVQTRAIVTIAFVGLTWLVGAGTIYLAWKPESRAYFNPVLQGGLAVPGVVLASVPTPFSADGELDTAAARRLIQFSSSATDGLMIAGSTAEFPSLDESERLALIEMALSEAGADRVIAHVGAPDAHHAARLAGAASRAGARNLAAVTPFYNAATPAELRDYYLRIRAAAPSAALYIYIFPERSGRSVPVPEFASLASEAGLAGAKLSGAAYGSLGSCVAACPSMRIYAGSDSDLAGVLRAGGAGVISARAAAYPEVFMGLARALSSGDSAETASWQSFVADLAALGTSVGLVKEALRLRGFGQLRARMPIDWPSTEVADRIASLVGRLPSVQPV